VSETQNRAGSESLARSRAPARITRAGRSLITRAELARLSGLSPNSLTSLYAQRARTGHPPAAEVDPARGSLYFDEELMLRWHHARRRATPPPRTRTLDLAGAPDDLLTMTQAAQVLGYRNPATIRSYRGRSEDYFPPPDHINVTDKGRQQLMWRRSSIWTFGRRRENPYPSSG
jgi:hypothetical protein